MKYSKRDPFQRGRHGANLSSFNPLGWPTARSRPTPTQSAQSVHFDQLTRRTDSDPGSRSRSQTDLPIRHDYPLSPRRDRKSAYETKNYATRNKKPGRLMVTDGKIVDIDHLLGVTNRYGHLPWYTKDLTAILRYLTFFLALNRV